ncbi:MAG TPA: DUF6152 family protein [Caulobacteraceae bacterium]|jgi:hypothetical protein|nr:DUF6152 family protein [Caulobacteraceae bacterium]
MKSRLFALACLALLTAAAPASAHHSAAIYDRAHPILLKGVIKDLQWMNPHGWIDVLAAPDGGKPTPWTIEMEGPNVMLREGWSRHSLLPGDRINALVMPLKDGRPGARLVEVTKADGTVLHLFTPRQGV